MSPSVTHAESYKFVTKWGSYGTGNGQFNTPVDVDVDSSGHVYVTDKWNHRVQKFDSNGKFITKWGSAANISNPAPGQFEYPIGVAVDSHGHVYVSDDYLNWIQEFDSSGNFITKWGSYGNESGQFWGAIGIAVDSSSNVYVTGKYNSCIQKFDSKGNFITKWGSYGTGNGEFNFPNAIDVDSSGNIYVSDLRHIQKFDSKGNFITRWTTAGTGTGEKTNLAVDSSGNVYFTNSAYNMSECFDRVKKFDSNGNLITQWGSNKGNGNGQFKHPNGIAIDSSGNVYVVDSGNNCVQKFAPIKTVIPVAKFTSNITSGKAPLTVKFTDKSTGSPTSWKWSFGDGTSSTTKNPVHTYTKAGKYTVSLTAKNAAGTNTKTIKEYITVKTATVKPVAAFSASPTSGTKPLKVQFTDKSTGSPTSWKWDFGDGTTSTTHNPLHTYIKKGTLTVKLTVKNAVGSSSVTKSKYITVK